LDRAAISTDVPDPIDTQSRNSEVTNATENPTSPAQYVHRNVASMASIVYDLHTAYAETDQATAKT
jgi:hypothetical protein